MAKTKKKFEWRERDCVDADVSIDTPATLVLYFYGNIPSKKNWRRNFWNISLPSANYVERNKRIISKLKDFMPSLWLGPYSIDIETIAHTKRRKDCDNVVSSIMDTLQDLGFIIDDDNETIRKITVTNIGYIKNAPITKIIIKQYCEEWYNINTDYKGTDLKQLKHLFNNYK